MRVTVLLTWLTVFDLMLRIRSFNSLYNCFNEFFSLMTELYPGIHPLLGLQFYTCGKLEWLVVHQDVSFITSPSLFYPTKHSYFIFLKLKKLYDYFASDAIL